MGVYALLDPGFWLRALWPVWAPVTVGALLGAAWLFIRKA
jgi:hypothetical protein